MPVTWILCLYSGYPLPQPNPSRKLTVSFNFRRSGVFLGKRAMLYNDFGTKIKNILFLICLCSFVIALAASPHGRGPLHNHYYELNPKSTPTHLINPPNTPTINFIVRPLQAHLQLPPPPNLSIKFFVPPTPVQLWISESPLLPTFPTTKKSQILNFKYHLGSCS